MEILQGAINRDEYYSVKECAEILGVTTKTIRNRIDDKKLPAVWYEIGKGQSQWLIPKEDIKAIVDKEVNTSRVPSVPGVLMDEIMNRMREENAALRQEIAEMKMVQQEIAASTERIEKVLEQRDQRLMETIRAMQEKQQEKSKPWWKFF